MSRPRPEPVQVVKERRDAALKALTGRSPYATWLGVTFERHGNELTAVLPYRDELIGNPMLPALHGGATGAFLEITAQVELMWSIVWVEIEGGTPLEDAIARPWPKVIDITVDYLRTGLPRDAYARARIVRSGRRYASVQVTGWQDDIAKPHAAATLHFLMPRAAG
jgi:acyl-coenzyme A thioesterase PaaI-like protein